jgi:nucleoside phosphorylase
MVHHFRPKMVAIVGIAAGVKSDAQGFGDVLAPDITLDYGAGKISSVDGKLHLRPDPNPIGIVPVLRDRLREWTLEHERLGRIRQGWQAKKPQTVLQVHVGPLGSGAAVVAAPQTVTAAQEHWRKLIGIEMEAYGVHLACQEAVNPPTMFLCMKSICDFAEPDKDDDWQHYAAFTAAQLFHAFVTEEWENLFPPEQYLEWEPKAWGDKLTAESEKQAGVLKGRIRNASRSNTGGWGGVWLERRLGFDARQYRRLGLELRLNRSMAYGGEIKLETPDSKKQYHVFDGPLSKLGRDGEWTKASLDITGCPPDILKEVGRVVVGTTAAMLPPGQEIELEIRRVVFLR